MPAAHASSAAVAPVDAVVLDLEHEPPGAVAGEEVLDRLRALAARARRADARAERDQRRAEVAALRRRRRAARRGCRRPSRSGAPRRRRCARAKRGEQLVGAVDERRDGHHRADPDDVAVDVRARRARCGGASARASGFSRPAAISGRRIVPPAKTVMPSPSPNRAGRLVGGRRNEHLGRHARDSMRRARASCVKRARTLRCARWRSRRSTSSSPRSPARRTSPDRGLATALYLSLTLEKPLLLEGEAGVGKTEAAKAIAAALGAPPDPAAVLRGPRHRARRLRVELRAAAAAHPRRAGGHGRRGGALRAASS